MGCWALTGGGRWPHFPLLSLWEPDLQVTGAVALAMTSLSRVATSAPFQSPFYHPQLAEPVRPPSTPPPQHGLYLISFGWGPLWEPGSRSRNAGSRQPGRQVLTWWGWGRGSRCDFLLMKLCRNTLISRSYNPIIILWAHHLQLTSLEGLSGKPPTANRGRTQSVNLLEEWVGGGEATPPRENPMAGVRRLDRAQWHLTFKVTSQMELLEFKGAEEAHSVHPLC